ncbi:hypothetical protein C2E23DRAFT_799018, partial [Lenzites betulinus]
MTPLSLRTAVSLCSGCASRPSQAAISTAREAQRISDASCSPPTGTHLPYTAALPVLSHGACTGGGT